MKSFEKSFASDISNVKPVIIEALAYMHEHIHDMSGEKEYDFKLALGEILLNAVIHGNHRDFEKRVFLRVQIIGPVVTAKVTDEGDGFDYEGLLAGFGKKDRVEGEHGRGIRLAMALTDELYFNGKGNEVVCSKRVVAYE